MDARRVRPGLWLAALLLWLAGTWHAAVAPLPPLTRLELLLSDARLALATPAAPAPRDDIVIVDIDDASLQALGRWPWPRERLARLIETLFVRDHVTALGVDLVLAEPDLDDAPLAAALRGHPVVLAFHFNRDAPPATTAPGPEPLFDAAGLGLQVPAAQRWPGLLAPAPALSAVAATGFINALPDADGELRSSALVGGVGARIYPAFSLALWRQWRGAGLVRPVLAARGSSGTPVLAGLELGGPDGGVLRRVRLDGQGAVAVPYRALRPGAATAAGAPGSGRFRYLPAHAVLSGQIGPQALAGRVVLLGSSAPGLVDLRATPIHPAMPGVEVHAHLLAGLEDDNLAVRPDWAPGFEVLALALVLLVVGGVVRRGAGPLSVLALAGVGLALAGLDVAALRGPGWMLPMAATFVGGSLLGVGGLATNYLREWQARRHLTELFGQYLPPERVRLMARDPGQFLARADRAENRELTVLFCDLRGFTTVSETLPPERVREMLNLYFSRMSEVIHAHGGTLDKYIGDAVMAFWGAPLADDQHARHAVEAALAMRAAMIPLNRLLQERSLPALVPQIGLATGVVCVGDLGSARRRSYTAVGDAVNLAARIESLTREFDTPLLVAQSTRDAAGPLAGATWREVATAPVRGRVQGVTLFTPLPSRADAPSPTIPLSAPSVTAPPAP